MSGMDLHADNDREAATSSSDGPSRAAADRLKGLHVLLAEDSSTLRRLITRTLEGMGVTVTAVENGQEAIDAVHAAGDRDAGGRPFDLILMDVVMPMVSGYEATYTLRSEGYQGRIIILTAADERYDLARNLCNGADDFLAKPFTPEDLSRIVKANDRNPMLDQDAA